MYCPLSKNIQVINPFISIMSPQSYAFLFSGHAMLFESSPLSLAQRLNFEVLKPTILDPLAQAF